MVSEKRAMVALVLLASGGAWAQGASAAAEEVFQQAKRLMGQNKVAEACDKFAESHRLEPASGTLLNLADCHVRLGKTATAWAEFVAAANLGQQQGKRVHVDEGNKRSKELERELSRLTIRVPHRVEGLKVTRGDEVIEPGLFGKALPIDPGKHTIAASAPGHKGWSTAITVGSGGDQAQVEVPALEPEAKAAPQASAAGSPGPGPAVPAPKAGAPVAGYVLWGVGAVATGVGAYFGLKALSTYDDLKKACPTLKGCTAADKGLRDDAEKQANIANVGVGVGLVALGVGTALVLMSGDRRSTGRGWTVNPLIGAGSGGALVGGSF